MVIVIPLIHVCRTKHLSIMTKHMNKLSSIITYRVKKLDCYVFHNLASSFLSGFLWSSTSFSAHFVCYHHSLSTFLSSQSVAMKSNRKARFSPSSTSTVTYTFRNDNSTLPKSTETPIKPPASPPIPITVHFHDHSAAACKIQAAYRSYVVRTLLKKIKAVEAEVDRLERLIQLQETVDAVRSSDKEKLRINEALMVQLLKLDSVPGFNQSVRDLRKSVSRRIVGLQEVMDGICGDHRTMDGWDLWRDWDEGFSGIEERVIRERGGEELERFCAHSLGFRCLERFLRDY